MSRYVDADELLNQLNKRYEFLTEQYGTYDQYVEAIDECIDRVENMPATDVKPIVRGEWKHNSIFSLPYCSKCFEENKNGETKFCPFCGSDMRGDKCS